MFPINFHYQPPEKGLFEGKNGADIFGFLSQPNPFFILGPQRSVPSFVKIDHSSADTATATQKLTVHSESKKNFLFEHNFRKYCLILIFFHRCRQKLSAHKYIIEFPTLPMVCCCTTFKNATAYTSSQNC